MTWRLRNKPTVAIDAKYLRHEAVGWLPIGWKIKSFAPTGLLKSQIDTSVTAHEFNRVYSADTFRIAFPPGTWVSDQRNGREYIVREDKQREILPAEIQAGMTYDEIVNSETGERLKARAGIVRRISIFVTILLIVCIALAIVHRYTRSAYASQGA
jgi:hypothetical protein